MHNTIIKGKKSQKERRKNRCYEIFEGGVENVLKVNLINHRYKTIKRKGEKYV